MNRDFVFNIPARQERDVAGGPHVKAFGQPREGNGGFQPNRNRHFRGMAPGFGFQTCFVSTESGSFFVHETLGGRHRREKSPPVGLNGK